MLNEFDGNGRAGSQFVSISLTPPDGECHVGGRSDSSDTGSVDGLGVVESARLLETDTKVILTITPFDTVISSIVNWGKLGSEQVIDSLLFGSSTVQPSCRWNVSLGLMMAMKDLCRPEPLLHNRDVTYSEEIRQSSTPHSFPPCMSRS